MKNKHLNTIHLEIIAVYLQKTDLNLIIKNI